MEMDNLDNDELFVIDNQILDFITNAVAIAGQEYARYKESKLILKLELKGGSNIKRLL